MAEASAETANEVQLAEGAEEVEEKEPEPQDCDSAFVVELAEAHALVLGEFSTPFAAAVSKRERDERGHMGGHFVYGEFSFRAMAATLSRIAAIEACPTGALPAGAEGKDGVEAGVLHYREALENYSAWESTEERLARVAGMEGRRGAFVDVGSGIGFACVAAALLGGFEVVRGLEVLEGLQAVAALVVKRWNGMGPLVRSEAALELGGGNVLSEDASDDGLDLENARVVLWCNGTWDDGDGPGGTEGSKAAAAVVEAKLEAGLEAGSFVVTCSAELASHCFDKCDETQHVMHWGECSVFIYRRNGAPPGQDTPWTGNTDE